MEMVGRQWPWNTFRFRTSIATPDAFEQEISGRIPWHAVYFPVTRVRLPSHREYTCRPAYEL